MAIEAYSGPIPRAEELAKYEAICPGFADRIISMTERQAAHRQATEKYAVAEEFRATARGTYSALAISAIALGVAGFLGYCGQQWAASIIGVADITGLAGVFMVGNHSREKERMAKAHMMAGRDEPKNP